MRGKAWLTCGGLALWMLGHGGMDAAVPAAGNCRRASLDGEVRAGEGYRAALGDGLEFVLQPIASGWIVRVMPAVGVQLEHDYAELATPPYHSVTPLSVSTDFSFRAQDAIGWNPREFRFATDGASYERLLAAHGRLGVAGATPSVEAERELAGLLRATGQGRLKILDARLVAGTADQWKSAAAVASHFSSTAHTLDEAGAASALGRIEWMRFRVEAAFQRGSRSAAAGSCSF